MGAVIEVQRSDVDVQTTVMMVMPVRSIPWLGDEKSLIARLIPIAISKAIGPAAIASPITVAGIRYKSMTTVVTMMSMVTMVSVVIMMSVVTDVATVIPIAGFGRRGDDAQPDNQCRNGE